MRLNCVKLCFLLIILTETALGQDYSYTLSTDSLVNFHASQKRVYTTQRIINRPRIDGKLDDLCWKNEGYWDGFFIQQQPHQGRPPSQKTEVKIQIGRASCRERV